VAANRKSVKILEKVLHQETVIVAISMALTNPCQPIRNLFNKWTNAAFILKLVILLAPTNPCQPIGNHKKTGQMLPQEALLVIF
jgi:hypothetical protein